MITGMENTLKASMITQIEASILAATGTPVATPNVIAPHCEGIANAIIPFLISNLTITVPPGVAVATAGGPTAQTGATTVPGIGTAS